MPIDRGIKMARKLFLSVLIATLLSSCGNIEVKESSTPPFSSMDISLSSIESPSSTSPDSSSLSSNARSWKGYTPIEGAYHLNYDAILLKDEEGEPVQMKLDIPYESFSFAHASTSFNKNLALSALNFVSKAPYKEKISEAYLSFGFEDVTYSPDYEVEESETTLLYVLGHKNIDGYNLINFTIAGYEYKKPWKENFNLGKTGNHQGFNQMALKALSPLIAYLREHGGTNSKVFINGYSRSAAIANILCTILLDNSIVSEANLYAYLFETPKGIEISNTKSYPSIFNIINSADLITYVSPTEYGHKRAGVDIDINNEFAEEILLSYDKNLIVPSFTPNNNAYQNDQEFIAYLLSLLLEQSDSYKNGSSTFDISSRNAYCDNIQDDASYLIGVIFSLEYDELSELTDSFDDIELSQIANILEDDGLYNLISPVLLEHGASFEEERLKASLNKLVKALKEKPSLMGKVTDKGFLDNALRTIYFHTLETVLPLLLNLD